MLLPEAAMKHSDGPETTAATRERGTQWAHTVEQEVGNACCCEIKAHWAQSSGEDKEAYNRVRPASGPEECPKEPRKELAEVPRKKQGAQNSTLPGLG